METDEAANRSVDFRVLSVFLLQLLDPLLLTFSLLLVQALQVLSSLMFLQHLVTFELLVALCIIVFQVFGGLDAESVFQAMFTKTLSTRI